MTLVEQIKTAIKSGDLSQEDALSAVAVSMWSDNCESIRTATIEMVNGPDPDENPEICFDDLPLFNQVAGGCYVSCWVFVPNVYIEDFATHDKA